MWIPVWLQAGFWGLAAGSALLIGAALGYFARIPQRLSAGIFAALVKNAVISFIDILSAILLRFRYFRMLTLPARIQDAVVGLVSIFRVLSPIKSPYSLEFEAVVADASKRENTNLNMCLRKFKT